MTATVRARQRKAVRELKGLRTAGRDQARSLNHCCRCCRCRR